MARNLEEILNRGRCSGECGTGRNLNLLPRAGKSGDKKNQQRIEGFEQEIRTRTILISGETNFIHLTFARLWRREWGVHSASFCVKMRAGEAQIANILQSLALCSARDQLPSKKSDFSPRMRPPIGH